MSSLVLAKFMTILLVLAHASMLLNSVSKSVSESSGTKRVKSSANLINSLLPDRVFKSSAKLTKSVMYKVTKCVKNVLDVVGIVFVVVVRVYIRFVPVQVISLMLHCVYSA